MSARKGLPWAFIVLTSSGATWAQATVADEPEPRPASAIRAAARDRRSISITDDAIPTGTTVTGETPEFHTVERGDTLWDITGAYFQNPWRWPGVWGLNPQITNPHWIFPGDQVRLTAAQSAPSATRPRATQSLNGALNLPVARVPPHTVFLREQGWLEQTQAESAGTVVGSPDDQMLLSEGDQAYVEFRQRTPHVGEQFTIYQDGQPATGSDRASGHVVRILGTATVESWDRGRHVATVRITESVDGIERGERVAAIPRRIDVIPPARNTVELRASIIGTVHPRELVGQNMVIFLDRGSADQIVAGNRLFVVRRGDAYARSLGTHSSNVAGTGMDRDGDGNVDSPPGEIRPNGQLPEEVVGEVLVTEVRAHSATALVTSAVVEVEVGDVLEMRRGY